VFLVVLNSCLSAFVSSTESGTVTEFGNIARMLVHKGVPYTLGMQFEVPDNAALVLSRALYDFLLQEHSVEEAVMHTRRALEEPGKLSNPHWMTGIPVLYTSLHMPAPPIKLAVGQPAIQPDPEQLENTCDLTALPPAEHFIGRGNEISQALDALLAPGAHGFVLLHGLGGIGKTATARAVAERIGWHYQDRVLAISFETFASIDPANQLTVNEQFADRFYNRLARFFGLDPAQYPFPVDLQRAILQRRAHLRSLLVLDNIETLVDAQRRNHPGAVALSSFISRLKEGDGAVLFTSRMIPPSDWGDCEIVTLSGLSDKAGAALFLVLLPDNRKHLAPFVARQALNRRVQGHPFSIRLLAGRFADEVVTDLITFLEHIEGELEVAEQATPTSIEDPERHKPLYACMDYSVRRLTPEQRSVLIAVSIFQTPFLPDYAANLLNDEEQTRVHLQYLVRLSLLEISAQTRTFQEGELVLLELHPMLRWYILHCLTAPDTALLERYGEIYAQLARTAYDAYDNDSRLRYLVRQSLPDFEAALGYLSLFGKSSLAYHLAKPYQRLGQNRHALALYEQALEMYQELGDVHNLATTQQGMGDMLTQLGKPQEALFHLEQALHAYQELGEVRAIAMTQASKADALAQLGKSQEALSLYEHSLRTDLELGEVRNVATTQQEMAHVLQQLGRLQEALTLYEQVLHTNQELGDMRSVATTQLGMAHVLMQLGKPQEALTLYEQVLYTTKELGDVQGLAASRKAMADVLIQLGKPQEAMTLYERSLRTDQELGNRRSVALTQSAMADVLVQLGKPQEAMALYEQSLRTTQELGDVRSIAATQANYCQLLFQQDERHRALSIAWEAYNSLHQSNFTNDAQVVQQLLISIKGQVLGPVQFDTLWKEVISETQPDWLCEVQVTPFSEEAHRVVEQMNMIVANTITVMTGMPEKREEWREKIDGALQKAQSINRSQDAEFFTAILAILNNQSPSLPVGHPYAIVFDSIQANIAAGGLNGKRDALPFDVELIPRSIAALLGGAQKKMEHAQYLSMLAAQTTDEGLKALINVIQLALFSKDLSQLGRDLKGVYQQTWEAIVVGVESGGVDPRVFDAIINNTLSVLGPASHQRSEWRNNLVELRNQSTTMGDRNMAALVDAAIGLLDAGGNPTGLGEDLRGVYAKTWQEIVEKLPGDIS
jgi:tetratricopeptide (TPR) repeat protein